MKRRDFLKYSLAAGGAAGLSGIAPPAAAAEGAEAKDFSLDDLPRQGPKPVASGERAVCSSSHPRVTETMLQVMRDGGSAVDAGVAGSLIQAVVEPHMTNHSGSVSFLYWEKKTGKAYQCNSCGMLVPGMPPFRPMQGGNGRSGPSAVIPGFMPGMKAIHERFGSKPWDYLCWPAIEAAEEGHVVHSFEYGYLEEEIAFHTYFPSGRELFTPDGFTPAVGERWRNPALAESLRNCAKEGPDYFISGDWAKQFVEKANSLGWDIKLEQMKTFPARWQEPLRYPHREHELLQLSPPGAMGVISALFLGILRNLDVRSLGHYTTSAESLYLVAHALRKVFRETDYLHDPEIFGVPVEEWLSPDYHAYLARVLKKSMPKIDLTKHVELTSGKPAMAAAGLPTTAPDENPPSRGSCELSIVDPQGNWVEMMHTLQGGGIPGMVVGGVPMYGSSASTTNMTSAISGWLVGGGRLKDCTGHTMVLRGGEPWMALGTPGFPHILTLQVLANVLEFGMDPNEASLAPRMYPLRDDYTLEIKTRIPQETVAGLAKLGIKVPGGRLYNWHMGSLQICWRDQQTGSLRASADTRRAGKAGGF